MERILDNINTPNATKVAIVVMTLTLTVFALALISAARELRGASQPVTSQISCADAIDEAVSVAAIATATGRVPGEALSVPAGTKFSVNRAALTPKSGLCK